ncbi:beta-glucosidase [Streptomyces sp. AK08-02]|uniref:beta-glucosidase n=1 Tax=Streptomyces sp. AK08-02 TaxID=3028654 RepID=UPI0029A44F77|nr:beta-glucosidase [Streptomyces sp. AK08-02]MDX3748864.1 beta-glucosidase [Streptomyces sp. AK08-02]
MSPCHPEEDFLPPPVSLSHEPAAPEPGQAVTLTAELTNTTGIPLRGTVLYLSDEAAGVVPLFAHALYDVHENGSDRTRATELLQLPYGSLAGAFGNTGISSDDATTTADIDGSRSSLSAEALASAGLTPGASVAFGGITFTWPDTGPGTRDNVVSFGRRVQLSGTGPGKVSYAEGTEQDFSVEVPDWYGEYASAAVVLPYRNTPSGRDDNPVSLFASGVALADRELHSVV